MADLPSDFWGGYIAGVTILSLLGLAWFVFSIYFSREDRSEEHVDGPTWDGNLREGRHPAPMWWFWLILTMMVFSVIYLMLYPGLGTYQGALKWSQGDRLDDSIAQYQAEFGGIRSLVAQAQVDTLQADAEIMASAQRVFNRNCAVCHGYDAAGQANYFPDLTDADWQWGASEAQIEQTIRAGRIAVMVGWEPVLGAEGVGHVIDYLGVIGTNDANDHPGQTQYNQFCIACHGPVGHGNAALGAPNLTDDVWLYGNSPEALRHSVAQGRSGVMPAFGGRLDDTQVKLLVALLTRNQP